jgi:hypothetical protein
LFTTHVNAQDSTKRNVLLGAVVVGNDTIPMVYLDEVIVYAKRSRRYARQLRREERRNERNDAAYARLRYNVYKVYPYAVTAAYLLKGVHEKLERLTDKRERKAYLKNLETELNKRFKGELEQFSIQQGIVLVKLINRQTGQNCFSIIQEVKGGFNAVVWQGVALLFSNNLKREYDPQDRDKDIEAIVQEIEGTAKKRS